MKYLIVTSLLLMFFVLPLNAQAVLDSKQMENSLTSDDFSDVVKTVWSELKKGVDAYHAEAKQKGEFETTAEFDARLQQRREKIASTLNEYAKAKSLADRRFTVWIKADLDKYNADAQSYIVKSKVKILIPPSSEDILITCPRNPYISITENTTKGYKFAYLVLKAKPDFTWYVNAETAQRAKQTEGSVFFRVWFRLEVSGALDRGRSELLIVPTKIALINQSDSATYWSEELSQ